MAVSVESTLAGAPDPRGLGGLLVGDQALPLRSCRVRGEVVGGLARTTVVQTYDNVRDQAMEAVHIFPLPDRGAVVSVVLSAGEVRVVAECRERKAAEAAFSQARAAGHRAALLTQERDDVHTLRVTNLPPRSSVQVEIVVEEALEVIDGRVQYRFPTTIAPRFTPGVPLGHQGPGVSPDTDVVMDASRLTPPLRLAGGTTLDLEVTVRGTVRQVSSSLHAVSMSLDDGAVRVAPSEAATLDRDFVLAVTFGEADTSGARAWTDGTHTVLVLEPPAAAMPATLPRDAVFVVDISGSMGGRKMDAAKLALKTALHGLMPQDRFVLVAFDDRVEVMKPAFSPVTDATLAQADRWIDALRARGGTIMAPALETALTVGHTPEGRQRTVLFVTDGQSTDEARLMQLLWQHRGSARVFPLGIDTAVNSALLRRMARLGGGVCELTTPRADIEAVVARLEARFGSPLVENVRVQGALAAQQPLPALFLGRPATVVLEGGAAGFTVDGTSAAGPWSVAVTPRAAPFPLGPTWARARVAALQDRLIVMPYEEDALRPEIVRLALAHGVATRWTAFVAVDTSVTSTGARVEVVQPAELPADWEAPTGAFGGAMPGAPLAAQMAAMPPAGPPPVMKRKKAAGAPRRRGIGAAFRDLLTGRAGSLVAEPSPVVSECEEAPAMADMADLDEGVAVPMPPSMPAPMPAPMPASGPRAAAAPPPPAKPRRSAARARLDPAKGAVRQEERAATASDATGALARRQSADGSFGGDLVETLSALLTLLQAGHTRRAGIRRKVVGKAVHWLQAHATDVRVAAVLDVLRRLEAGESVPAAEWSTLAAQVRAGR